jgi:diphosphomevalonate decarboxylase
LEEIRKQNHMNVCFTLDAGPNLHLLYPEKESEKGYFNNRRIKTILFRGKVIHDK